MGGESGGLTSVLQNKGAGGMPLGATRISMRTSSQHRLFKEGVVWVLGTQPSAAPERWEF